MVKEKKEKKRKQRENQKESKSPPNLVLKDINYLLLTKKSGGELALDMDQMQAIDTTSYHLK
jgi:hypothetical protein